MKRFPRRRALASVLCLILVWLLVRDWRDAQPYNDGTWQRVQQSGILRVGMDASYPPFADTPAGQPVGLDVDIANEVGRRLNLKVQIANMGFDGLYEALKTSQVDVLISALSYDPTRLNAVIYSVPYLDSGQVIVSRDGSYPDMPSLDGHTVAVEYGSGGDEQVRIWQRRLHELPVTRFTTSDEALAAVAANSADAALTDAITARLYISKYPGLVISPQMVTHDLFAAATRNSSYDLAGAISDTIKAMQQDGTLDMILNRWL
jgi:ABC-type amino acid transport substrate-binding protein